MPRMPVINSCEVMRLPPCSQVQVCTTYVRRAPGARDAGVWERLEQLEEAFGRAGDHGAVADQEDRLLEQDGGGGDGLEQFARLRVLGTVLGGHRLLGAHNQASVLERQHV